MTDHELKYCVGCCKPKPMGSFPLNPSAPDGRLRHCRDCIAAAKAPTPLRPMKTRRELLDDHGMPNYRFNSPTGIGDVFEGSLVGALANVFRQMEDNGLGRRSEG